MLVKKRCSAQKRFYFILFYFLAFQILAPHYAAVSPAKLSHAVLFKAAVPSGASGASGTRWSSAAVQLLFYLFI